MQLAREAAALELLRLDNAPERVARNPLREIDRDRRARAEGLGEPEVVVRKAGIRQQLVVRGEQADRAATRDERNPETGPRTETAHDLVVDLGIVENRVDALAAAALDHAPALRRRPRHRLPDQVGASLAGNCDKAQLVGAGRKQHGDEAGVEQLAQAAGDEIEQTLEVGLRASAFPTSFSDSSCFDHCVDAS